MSHYLRVKTVFRDKDCLLEALSIVGYPINKIEIYDEAQNLYGYQGDMRFEKAHIIIRRQNISASSNDVGFFKNSDGEYEAIISEYDSHFFNEKWITNLKKEYSVRKVRKECLRKGMTVREQRMDNGKVRLTVKGWR